MPPRTTKAAGKAQWDGMKVVQLKDECRARGLKVSGTKQELLERLRIAFQSQPKAALGNHKQVTKVAKQVCARASKSLGLSSKPSLKPPSAQHELGHAASTSTAARQSAELSMASLDEAPSSQSPQQSHLVKEAISKLSGSRADTGVGQSFAAELQPVSSLQCGASATPPTIVDKMASVNEDFEPNGNTSIEQFSSDAQDTSAMQCKMNVSQLGMLDGMVNQTFESNSDQGVEQAVDELQCKVSVNHPGIDDQGVSKIFESGVAMSLRQPINKIQDVPASTMRCDMSVDKPCTDDNVIGKASESSLDMSAHQTSEERQEAPPPQREHSADRPKFAGEAPTENSESSFGWSAKHIVGKLQEEQVQADVLLPAADHRVHPVGEREVSTAHDLCVPLAEQHPGKQICISQEEAKEGWGDRSRSPRLPASILASLPTAARKRYVDTMPSCSPSPAVRFALKPSPQAPVEEPAIATPSKFNSIYERLKAKAEAKDRGEDVNASWTPRPSPLRRSKSDWQAFAPAPAASPVATSRDTKDQPASGAGLCTPEVKVAMNDHTLLAPSMAPSCSPVESTPKNMLKLNEEMHSHAPPSSANLPWHSHVASTPRSKRASLMDDKKRMLEELTKQMKLCIERLQESQRNKDEERVEKYQELAKSLGAQLDKINVRAPESSPAAMRSPAFSPAAWYGDY